MSFSCDITFDVILDLEEVLLLENVVPILIVVGHGVFKVNPGEIDFIPFQVSGQCCQCSQGIPTLTYHPYRNCSIKGQCCCDPGGWCNEPNCHGGRPF